MPTYAAHPTRAYRSSSVLTAPPEQLVVMLYDGARRFLHQAAVAMRERQIPLAHAKLTRAEDILRHLRSTLDHAQGGEIAERLRSIYTFCLGHCSRARVNQDPAKLEEVSSLLAGLRDSWAAVASAATSEDAVAERGAA
jgi:flagellar secretion chaperone FliS